MSASLQSLLASRVLDALQARDHVLIAPKGGDALHVEMEDLIATSLPTITPHLDPTQAVMGEITNTFGHDDADDAVEKLVHHIAERLMESEHVDDIFAEDRLIRRDAFRAISDVLVSYQRGELEVAESSADSGQAQVALDQLGYVAATVAQIADEHILTGALECAAEVAQTTLCAYDEASRVANFALPSSDAENRLGLEEAITEALVDLVDHEVVELPSVEQVLQVDQRTASSGRFAAAILQAVRHTQQETGCAVACGMVDECTMLASLTPLTEEDARDANTHFDAFLQTLEETLSRIDAAE